MLTEFDIEVDSVFWIGKVRKVLCVQFLERLSYLILKEFVFKSFVPWIVPSTIKQFLVFLYLQIRNKCYNLQQKTMCAKYIVLSSKKHTET